MGLSTVVDRNHLQIGLDLNYMNGMSMDLGPSDPYHSLDRFGRVIEQQWTVNTAPSDDFAYGYDRNGNRQYRANNMNHAFDELYHVSGANQGYDNLKRRGKGKRGREPFC